VLGISIKPTGGEILDGKTPIRSLNTKEWRNICGVLMQDGFIFSDTIENNICDGMK
jgi:ATP-binding cassette subfamily B protein